ncbi:hypothetical protein RBH29_07000 [Herbivorax sp. ANBcel31]|uniref:hypothetical protein n=1 Tax=Herbivorax sp. ANBcel31 TaxID=3069754 RepID=UPI0027B85BC9|nr:hypothetical protein [Herbivorax sp. ANBcel31]MDQ2086177.1 hypothetical protein [Herbivorax sp. ANBcel31]
MNRISVGMLIVAVILLILKYLMLGTEKKAVIKDGAIVLKMSRIYGVIGFSGILVSIAIMTTSALGIVGIERDIKVTIGFSMFLLVMGIFLFLLSINVQVFADEDKITHYNIIRQEKEIMWEEIRRVTFNKGTQELIIEDANTKIKMHIHIVGFFSFIELMKSKIDHNLYKGAIGIIDTYKKQK